MMPVTDFETEWQKVVALVSNKVAPEIKTGLSTVFAASRAEPMDAKQLWLALNEPLTFLSTSNGRTDANCWATDLFLTLADGPNWEQLPEELAEVMCDMAGALHDTVAYPEVAENFGGLPEQLLAKLRDVRRLN